MIFEFAEKYGFIPHRRRGKRGFKPHLSLRFRSTILHVDSYAGEGYNLISHAHSDHYGHCNIRNRSAIASIETAKILEAVTGKKFVGKTFMIGETLKLDLLKIKTYPTQHMDGASAFLIKERSRVLVTGDVKDYKHLPKCDVLVTEATYGQPDYVFEDEIDRLLQEAQNSTFGVYPIGKAQRVARILIKNGFSVKAESKIRKVCAQLGIEVKGDGVELVPTRDIWKKSGRKFVLTAQKFYRIPRITISDHLDYEGIIRMVEHCNPEHVIFYHGNPTKELLEDLRGLGYSVSTLKDLDAL